VRRKGYFTDAGTNTDLAGLGPVAVINAFFDAINNGDMVRANACLSPQQMLDALTVNLLPNRLYNPGFGANNSLAANIESGRLLSWSFVTYDKPSRRMEKSKVMPAGDRVEVAAELQIRWRDNAFNTPTGMDSRFIVLSHSYLGWKIEGMGTGP